MKTYCAHCGTPSIDEYCSEQCARGAIRADREQMIQRAKVRARADARRVRSAARLERRQEPRHV